VKAPTGTELTALASRIAERVGRFLERQGLLERDAESPLNPSTSAHSGWRAVASRGPQLSVSALCLAPNSARQG
jgi:hypothetical protein